MKILFSASQEEDPQLIEESGDVEVPRHAAKADDMDFVQAVVDKK